MTDLIKHLEGLDGACRETDWRIACEVLKTHKTDRGRPGQYISINTNLSSMGDATPFTSSVDAALTLVPEGMGYLIASSANGVMINLSKGYLGDSETEWYKIVKAPTLPLAICIASLRARGV